VEWDSQQITKYAGRLEYQGVLNIVERYKRSTIFSKHTGSHPHSIAQQQAQNFPNPTEIHPNGKGFPTGQRLVMFVLPFNEISSLIMLALQHILKDCLTKNKLEATRRNCYMVHDGITHALPERRHTYPPLCVDAGDLNE